MVTIPEQIALWEKINADPEYFPFDPEPWLAEKLEPEDPKMRRAIDLGCGHGRHLVWLANRGWRATGIDWAQNAIRFSKARLAQADAIGEVIKGDFRKMNIPDGHFQIAVASRALNHFTLHDFQRALHEIKRIMRIGGKLYFNVPSIRNAPRDVCLGRWIEEQTLAMDTGREAQIPHHFFTKEELAKQAIQWRQADIETVVEPLPADMPPLHEDHVNEWYWVILTR